jgi:hypothetical protein
MDPFFMIITVMYVVSLFIIIFVGYRKYNEVNNKYKKLRQDLRICKLQAVLADVIDIQIFLEEEADRAALNILRSDDPSYFQGMEQAFRESKIALNSKVKYLQKEIRKTKIDNLFE